MWRCCCAASCGYQGAPASHQVQLQVGTSNARYKEDDRVIGMGAAHLPVLGVGRLGQVLHDQGHGQHQLGLGGHARGHWGRGKEMSLSRFLGVYYKLPK